MNHNKTNSAGYNEAPKFGPSEHNPPKIEFHSEYVLDNRDVDISLPGGEISDADNLRYFFEKYISSVERGKANQRMAEQLKTVIDIIQVKSLANEQAR